MRVLLYPLIASGYVLLVLVAGLLVRTYRRTHDSGFLWLGAAFFVPLIIRLLWAGFDSFVADAAGIRSIQSRMTTQAVVTTFQQVTSLVFLLIAVLQLGRTKMCDPRTQ